MDDSYPHRNKRLVIWLVAFGCVCLLTVGAVLTATRQQLSQQLSWTEGTPPNGTTGSAQPGTIGLARPHPPLPAR